MIGIFKRPMDMKEAYDKYLAGYRRLDCYAISMLEKHNKAISSEYTLPKKALEKIKYYYYASTPLAMRIESAFL